MELDYSLYLVTDSTPAVLGKKKIEDVVQAAVDGGATIVQYREKHAETADMIKTAESLCAICQKSNTPLIINDRVDIALATKAQGVHLGQTDMSTFPQNAPVSSKRLKCCQEITVARQILGPKAIIGATVSSIDEAVTAIEAGADYLGIGTVYATPTYVLPNHPLSKDWIFDCVAAKMILRRFLARPVSETSWRVYPVLETKYPPLPLAASMQKTSNASCSNRKLSRKDWTASQL